MSAMLMKTFLVLAAVIRPDLTMATTTNSFPPHTDVANDICLSHCHCGPLASEKQLHNWRVAESAYRLQMLMVGRGKNYHRQFSESNSRQMTCIGISEMPVTIPADIMKLTIYGDSYGPANLQRQRDEADKRAHIDWDTSFFTEQLPEYHQIDVINPAALVKATHLQEVFIEGNKIKAIRPSDFPIHSDIRLLSFRSNQLEEIGSNSLQGLRQLESADFSKNSVAHIGRHAFVHTPYLKKLTLSNNRLQSLSNAQLTGLRHLTELDLAHNALTVVDAELFAGLHKLTHLNMAGNELTQTRPWFGNLEQLRVLQLSNNRLARVADSTFDELVELRELNLSKNNLTALNYKTFAALANLDILDLSHNSIVSIEDRTFQNLVKLRVLRLSGNSIGTIGSQTFLGLLHLHIIHLEDNNISEISNQALRIMPNLRSLYLSRNHLSHVARYTFKGMLELREIRLDRNRVKRVDDEAFSVASLSNLSKMTWIYLQNNLLTSVTSQTFHGLPFLRHLDLGSNDLRRLDKFALRPVTNLASLSLKDNELLELLPQAFVRQRVLRVLSVSGNGIEALAADALAGLVALEDFDASDNELTHISDGVFTECRKLMRLDLSSNHLRTLNFTSIGFVPGIRHLMRIDASRNKLQNVVLPISMNRSKDSLHIKSFDLGDNALESLEETIADAVMTGGELRLQGNPWTCDCHLSWLPGIHRSRRITLLHSNDVACKVPSTLTGVEVASIADSQFACYPEAELTRERSAILCKEQPEQLLTIPLKQTRSRKQLLSSRATVIRRSDGQFLCDGVRVALDWVLTPASCWLRHSAHNVSDAIVVFGTSTRKKALTGAASTGTLIRMVDGAAQLPSPGGTGDSAATLIQVKTSAVPNAEVPCVLDEYQLETMLARRVAGRALGKRLGDGFRIDVETVAMRARGEMCQQDSGAQGEIRLSDRVCASVMHRVASHLDMSGSVLHYDLQSHWATAGMHFPLARSLDVALKELTYTPLYLYADWIDATIKEWSPTELPDRKKNRQRHAAAL